MIIETNMLLTSWFVPHWQKKIFFFFKITIIDILLSWSNSVICLYFFIFYFCIIYLFHHLSWLLKSLKSGNFAFKWRDETAIKCYWNISSIFFSPPSVTVIDLYVFTTQSYSVTFLSFFKIRNKAWGKRRHQLSFCIWRNILVSLDTF